MVRCHLSTLMGRHKLRVSDVARLTGLNRSTVSPDRMFLYLC